MEGGGKWRVLRDRLSFKGMACCGGGLTRSSSFWRPSDMIEREDEEEEDQQQQQQQQHHYQQGGGGGEEVIVVEVNNNQEEHENQLGCGDDEMMIPTTATPTGMNLATALAAERQLRAQVEIQSQLGEGHEQHELGESTPNHTTTTTTTTTSMISSTPATPPLASRVSLMALLEEGEREEREMMRNGNGEDCCVCMGRRKGAAFIPCGHTFCRVCSRELWLNRGSCPLCNRSILEILDIY